ncbi:PspC domain-containing protein [Listeria sp. FSL L7-1510]|nr:PspC domain-containing protein [Listeria immobilis]
MISGVCGGLAEYFGIEVTIIRLIWAGLALFAGGGILLYIIAAIIIPKATPESEWE